MRSFQGSADTLGSLNLLVAITDAQRPGWELPFPFQSAPLLCFPTPASHNHQRNESAISRDALVYPLPVKKQIILTILVRSSILKRQSQEFPFPSFIFLFFPFFFLSVLILRRIKIPSLLRNRALRLESWLSICRHNRVWASGTGGHRADSCICHFLISGPVP